MQCPVGGSVVGCGAWAVSRKTPIYFINFLAWPGWFVGNKGFIITMATMLGRPKGIWEDQKDL